jgi:hypothetical protein
VGTWIDETKTWIPVKNQLLGLDTVALISNLAGDNLKATRYDADKNQIYVEGFAPDAKRVLTVRYQGSPGAAWYSIIVKSPDGTFEDYGRPPEGIADWVTVSPGNSLLMNPGDTQDIVVSLCIPSSAAVSSQRFMFWVWIAESTDNTFGNAVAVTWLVNMGR